MDSSEKQDTLGAKHRTKTKKTTIFGTQEMANEKVDTTIKTGLSHL
jgi:hypothetical protein